MKRKWLFPLGLIIVLCVAFFLYARNHVAPAINLATLDVSDLEGKPVNMQSFKGKKIALSFGASWCPNCLEEMQDLSKIKDQELSDVEVIIISDESYEKIKAFKEKHNYPFTFLKLNTGFSAIGITAIPTSYIVNTKLQVTKESVGYVDWKDPSTVQHLKKLME